MSDYLGDLPRADGRRWRLGTGPNDVFCCTPQFQVWHYRAHDPGVFRGTFCGLSEGPSRVSVLPPFLQRWGWTAGAQQFLAEWFESEHVLDADVLRVLERIQESAWAQVHLATNQEAHRIRYLLDEMGLKRYAVDPVFASCRIGHIKPSAEYFAAVMDALDWPPDAVLFWDDALANIDRAREMGIRAELFRGTEHFVDTMQRWFPDP